MFKEKVKYIAREAFETFCTPQVGIILGTIGIGIGIFTINTSPNTALLNTILGGVILVNIHLELQLKGIKKQLDSIEEKINHKTML